MATQQNDDGGQVGGGVSSTGPGNSNDGTPTGGNGEVSAGGGSVDGGAPGAVATPEATTGEPSPSTIVHGGFEYLDPDAVDEIVAGTNGGADEGSAGVSPGAKADGTSNGGEPAGNVPGTQQPTEVPSQQQHTEHPQVSPEVAALQAELAQLRQQLQANQGQQPAQNGQNGEGSGEPPLPDYNFTIPPQLLEMLDSEDPTQRQQGVAALAQGTAQEVHRAIRQEMTQVFGGVPQMVQAIVGQMLEARQMFDDFYGTYQAFNKPELRPVIVQVAERLQAQPQWQGVGWTSDFRDAVAKEAAQVLGISLAAPGAAPAAAASVASPPPSSVGGAGRPAVAPQTVNGLPVEVASVFGS